MSLPIATVVSFVDATQGEDEMERLIVQRDKLLELIEDLKLAFVDFCMSTEEAEEILSPIEENPHPYATGETKTSPILMKYAKYYVELAGIYVCIEEEEERVRNLSLTPFQVKALLKSHIVKYKAKIVEYKAKFEVCEAKIVEYGIKFEDYETKFGEQEAKIVALQTQITVLMNYHWRQPMSDYIKANFKFMHGPHDFTELIRRFVSVTMTSGYDCSTMKMVINGVDINEHMVLVHGLSRHVVCAHNVVITLHGTDIVTTMPALDLETVSHTNPLEFEMPCSVIMPLLEV